ncbi:LacI family DNA-binding transcriptional regulator [Reinekea marinisedimentorum]|nr:LacI family DNA-binding transcriptional regulator [Reinekea marinisedimentorum]
MTTIKDVAKAAGTSFKTVSRVINNDDNVTPETRKKVQDAIKALGYRPNTGARMIRSKKSGVIGLIADQAGMSVHSVNLIRGAQEEAWAQGKFLMVINIDDNHQNMDAAIDKLLERRVEGIIYAAMYHHAVNPSDELRAVPLVLANCYDERGELPCVVPDEYAAACDVTRHLINTGHRRIAYLNLNPRIIAGRERSRGFLDTIHQHPAVDGWTEKAISGEIGQEVSRVDEVMSNLLNSDRRPDAILCGKDEIAMSVYFSLVEHSLQPGHDMAVASFDNLEIIAESLKPGLSTMALPHYEMGQWAIRHLLSENLEISHERLSCDFIRRASA